MLSTRKNIGKLVISGVISLGTLLCVIAIAIFLTSCGQTIANTQRTFLDIKLDYLGEYRLPQEKFQDTVVGGLSGITYDRQKDLFYAVSDDRSGYSLARFYTLKLNLKQGKNPAEINPELQVMDVTILKDQQGKPYPNNTIDPEAIALSPKQTVYISSEGDRNTNVPPFIGEFDLQSGKLISKLPIPPRYLPSSEQNQGVQNNLAFESLTLVDDEPNRLFTATESALIQDREEAQRTADGKLAGMKNRWLHYLLGEPQPQIISEHLYQLDPPPAGAIEQGLSEISALDKNGHFLTLERSVGLLGFNVKIFQAATGGATDTSLIESFRGNNTIRSIEKQLVLDLANLGIYIDNLEGMTFGPKLADGSPTLLMVSDNNFKAQQITQFLLFKLILTH